MLTVQMKVNVKVEGYGIVSAGQIRDFEDEDYAKGLVKDGLAASYQKPATLEDVDSDADEGANADEGTDAGQGEGEGANAGEGEEVDLDELTVAQLKEVAKQAEVKSYSSMNREELIQAIVAASEESAGE